MMKEILFTHTDLDGAGCQIVYELAHQGKVKGVDYDVINSENNTVDQDVVNAISNNLVSTNTEVFFADICANEPVLDRLMKDGYNVTVFDHHITNTFANIYFPASQIIPINTSGVKECGTSILYKYYLDKGVEFHNKEIMDTFVELVRLYDTYEFKEVNIILARHLQVLLTMIGLEAFVEKYLDELSTNLIDFDKDCDIKDKIIDTASMKFINAKLNKEKKILKDFTTDDVVTAFINGRKIAFMLTTKGASFSELSQDFLKKNPDYDVCALFGFYSTGPGGFQFRTIKDDINTAMEIAQPMGGGGHPRASGAPIRETVKNAIINILLNEIG